MAKAKKISKVKIKKKRWFPVFAPKFLGQKELGESYLANSESAVGRNLKVNLKELTGSIKDQNIYVSLRIKEITGNNLQTEVTGYAYMPFFIKRLIRRNIGKIEDSFVLKTKDGKNIRLKPLIITVFAINKSLKTVIRKEVIKILSQEVSKSTFDNLIVELLKYKLQMELKKKLKKICPIREMIMRVAKLEERKKVKVIEVEKEDVVEAKKEEVKEAPKREEEQKPADKE